MAHGVRDFYDTYGWQKSGEEYGDAEVFLDRRSSVQAYLESAEQRARAVFADAGGTFFLDAGCGANPRVDLSVHYSHHVCVDFSIQGLREAREKVGAKGHFVLADMTCLPFPEGVFDGAVSAHSIYHVPGRAKQGRAFHELYRTLKSGGRVLILYINPYHRRYFDLSLGSMLIRNMIADLKGTLRSLVTGKNRELESDEGYYQDAGGVKADWYFRAFPIGWVRSNLQEGAIEVRRFRVWTHEFTKRFVRDSVFWRGFLGVTSALEGLFPRALSYFGHYVMYRVRK